MRPEELKEWRTKRRLTQQSLADLLSVTKPTISRWESGSRHIPAFLPLALKCLKLKKKHKTIKRIVQKAMHIKTAQEVEEYLLENILLKYPK